MSERLRLAEHFIDTHGRAAARALEELPAEIAGSLIDAIADPLSLSSLKNMLPYHAARCLVAMAPDAGSKYLASLAPRDAAAILRHMEARAAEERVALLPKRQALRVSLIMGYPQSLVGAWMDPLALTLPVTGTVGDARTRLRNEGYEHSVVFIVDDENRVRGSVSLVELLLRADDATSLSTLMVDEFDFLLASSTLERALDDKGWFGADILPVIDRGGGIIGVLRFGVLRRALIRSPGVEQEQDEVGGLLGISEACYLGLADLLAVSLATEHDETAPS